MIYVIMVTVEVTADSQNQAYDAIKAALFHAKKLEISFIDAEVVETREEDAP